WAETQATLHAGWRWWVGEIAAMMPDGLRNALSPGDPVIAIDMEDKDAIVRRFANGGEQDFARLKRSDFTPEKLRAVLHPYLSKAWFLRDSFALRIGDSSALWRNLSL